MDVFTTSATAVSVLAALVTLISKLAAMRIERRRDHTIADVKWWAGSDDGRHWIRGYVAEWMDGQADRTAGSGQGGGQYGRHTIRGGSNGGGGGGGSGECNNHGYLDSDEAS